MIKWIITFLLKKKFGQMMGGGFGLSSLTNVFPGLSDFERRIKRIVGRVLMLSSIPFLFIAGLIYGNYHFDHSIWLAIAAIPGIILLISGFSMWSGNRKLKSNSIHNPPVGTIKRNSRG
ncbi:MAG TPA: hypothetical protein VF691_06540 [Cytophagaceae bacterium]|jgi:hypothetical protein